MGMSSVAGRGKKKGARPEMNVTPLVDVVLVLLIIFMVVMPSMNRFFRLYLPSPADDDRPEPYEHSAAPIVVTVNADGEYQINSDVYSDAAFTTRLHRMLVARRERKIYFDAANNAPFERAAEALDLSRQAGAAHIAVLTAPLE